MLKGFSLSAKLYFGFASVLAITAALGAFNYLKLGHIKSLQTLITTSCLPGVYEIEEINALMLENQTNTISHIFAASKEEKEAIDERMAGVKGRIDKAMEEYGKTITRDEDRKLFEAIKPARQAYADVRRDLILPLSHAMKEKEADEAEKKRLEPLFKEMMDAIDASVAYNRESGHEAGSRIEWAVNNAKVSIVIGLILAVALGAAIGIFLSRSISSALNKVIASLTEGSEQVSSASQQVSQSSQQMAQGASEQASSLEETSASLEEMSSMTRQNSGNARQANETASDTRQAVEKSREAMERMSRAIGQIKESSDQTAKIVKTIDEIAFQTNLLALNAAVEAARAGDAGKGFAVVAEEVRNLAQRSAEAAKTTSSLIEESQKNAEHGVAVSQEVAGILSRIVDSVGKLSQLIGEVSRASQEQAKGIEQIGTAVTQMDKLTQANAANAEESASASEELSAQARELNDMVNVLVGIVSGRTAESGMRQQTLPASGSRKLQSSIRKTVEANPAKASTIHAIKCAPNSQAGQDWKSVAAGGNSRNGYSPAMAKADHAESAIPLNKDELKDF
jgi:methyl-accepting chemotaxis protein